MPSTTSDPPRQRSGRSYRPKRPPIAVAAAVAAGLAALVSYLPVAMALGLFQLAEQTATFGAAARLGLAGWLLGHGVPLGTGAGQFGLPPLALGLLAAWRVIRAGVHTTRAIGARNRRSLRQALAAATAVGVAYGLIGMLAAVITGTAGLEVSPLRAGVHLVVFGVLAALIGSLRTTGAVEVLAERVPPVLRDGLRTGAVAAALLLAAGAGAAGLAVAIAGGEASDMIGAYRTGVAGQAGITVVSAAYAPNAAIWAAAYLLGPGFTIGTGSVVRTTEVTLGALPAVPLLAGLPHGPVGGFGAALLTVPVLAGAAAGWLLARRIRRTASPEQGRTGWAGLLAAAAVSGQIAGILLGLAAIVSGGPLGDGRLSEIGPVGWQVAAAASVLVTLGTLLGAAATRAFTNP
ncbi:MAG TPA: DUF6350 family protein [Micromonosporaceae bacterium]|nr:DUF6350 family protein [Micromonosporaceae bacterium]